MNRTQEVAVVLGLVVVALLASCGRQGPCPDCARSKKALADAQQTIADLQAERNQARPYMLQGGGDRLVRDGDVPMDQPDHAGQVLSVDSGANAVVISLGSDDGVELGFRYTVSRGSQYVAMIEITDVGAKESAGRSIESLQKTDIQLGDRVMSR